MELTRTEFEKQLESLAAQSLLLSKITKTKGIDALCKVVSEEAERVTRETNELQERAKVAGII